MVFPIVGGDGKPTGYDIDNSLRFNDADKHYLERTFDSGGSQRTFTISVWVKRSEIGATNPVWGAAPSNGGQCSLQFNSSDQLVLREYNTSDEEVMNLVTSAKFRDPAAWYHIVAAVDTTDGTASNRAKLYVNGTIQSLGTATYPNQNYDLLMNNTGNTGKFFVGTETYSSVNVVFDGYMSEFYIINNSQLTPTSFGEEDTNGVWIPTDASGNLTFGANGLYLEFKQTGTGQNSSGIGADTSGEDHHFAINNNAAAFASTDITTDTPTNNFITVNPLMGVDSSARFTFSEGNTVITQADNGNWRGVGSTIALTSGKWYWEVQNAASGGTNFRNFSGVIDANIDINNTTSYDLPAASLWYNWNNGEINTDGTYTTADYGGGSSGSPIAQGDTLGILLNMDDDEVSFFKNGSALVEGFSLSTNISTAMPFHASGESADTFKINFGNPAHSISSSQADDNGYGNFEYDVPAGYYAICTKNLAEYG